MKVLLKISGFLLILVGAVVVLLSLSLNDMTKASIERLGPELTGTSVTLKQVNLSLLSGNGELQGLTIGNPSGFQAEHALKLGKVQVDISLPSVVSDTIAIEEILIERPELVFEGNLTSNNFQQIRERVEAYGASHEKVDERKDTSTTSKKKVEIDHLFIKDAQVELALSILDGKGPTISLPDIHLQDIGKKTNGATWQEVVEQLLDAVESSILQAIPKAGKHIERGIQKVTESLQDLGVASKDAVSDVFKGIEGLLQPKKEQ